MSLAHVVRMSVCLVVLLAVAPTALAQENSPPEKSPVPAGGSKVEDLQAETETVDAKKDAQPKDEVADKLRQKLIGAWLMAPKPG